MNLNAFGTSFKNLTGHEPFPWSIALYDQWFSRGRIPALCDIPTGLGKTSVVAVWLIALAHHPDKLPRRLVYVVNRRTVVDQTTAEVEKLRQGLEHAGLADHLRGLCAIPLEAGEPPLAISTLRGQFADNREWSADPCRPAVIVGTVDLIGSRLLFSGYRIGFRSRPLHAGFLGQDALLIHDEAHLEPAFQKLIEAIQDEQHQRERVGPVPWRKLHVMALTATGRKSGAQQGTLELTAEEKQPQQPIPDPPTQPVHTVWRRLTAPKKLHLKDIEEEKKQLADSIATLALDQFQSSGQAILIYARTVEDVLKIVEKLKKDKQQVQQLTGTMRGLERDELPQDPIFARFLPPGSRRQDGTPAEGTVYLVCTSAGEVGVNISADHLVCDLTTFESMAQRFGRVNRFGERQDTTIHVIHPQEFDKADAYELRRKRTLELLKQLNGDASPLALSRLDPQARLEAFAPEPTILPVSDILFDAWALTSIREALPGRPPVEPFLHGLAEWQPPETSVAWREEVQVFDNNLLDYYKPEDLLDDYPVKPHELLRDRSDRVFKCLQELAERHPDLKTWLIDDYGKVEILSLQQLADKSNQDRIHNATILLPPAAGGLSNGMLDRTSETAADVADQWRDEQGRQRRVRVWDDDPAFDQKTQGMRLIRTIDTRPDADEEAEEEAPSRRYWHWYVRPTSADDDVSKTATQPIRWDDHTCQVVEYVSNMANKLNLPDDLKQALKLAARWHDLGKKREQWQLAIGNPNPTDWHAKGGKGWQPRELNDTYRHEFGSLLDAGQQAEWKPLSPEQQDLVLHLIAAHHGRGRPHFVNEEIFDPNYPEAACGNAALEVPRRFARLQRKYGRWGLAYLESLLRAADYAASARPTSSGASS